MKAAGDNKSLAIQAHLTRATLLVQMAGRPTDKKLREAEEDIRQALALEPSTAIAHLDLGIVLLKQERDPEGIAELKLYVESPGADPSSLAEARRIMANPVRARSPFAPDFSFTTEEEQNLSNASLRGKVVLLDFWGTWCPPCRESVPMLRNLNKKYSGKAFELVGISSDDDVDVWKTFIAGQKMNWSEYIDLQRNVLDSFKVDSFPTYVVLDKDGVVRFRQSGIGPTTEGDLEEAIGKALKREPDPKLVAALAAESQTRPGPAPAAQTYTAPLTTVVVTAPTEPPAVEEPREIHHLSQTTESGIDEGVVIGNVYKNHALRMSFEFPPNWIAAKHEVLKFYNERDTASTNAAIQQHPELANSTNISIAKLIFYASKKGAGDGQRIEVPSIRITALPSHGAPLTQENFQRTATQMAGANSMRIIASPSGYQVDAHAFFRADMERATGAKYYTSFVQTLAGDYLLHIELFAYSKEELDTVASSLQAISISSDNP